MQSEIGSNFWLNPKENYPVQELGTPAQFGCSGSDYVWMSTGRSATKFVLKTIQERNPQINKVALLPSFTCHTVIEPFIEYGWTINYYDIDSSLNASADEIINRAKLVNCDVVLFHRYFGFDTIDGYERLCAKFRSEGILSIEDITQCLYSDFQKSQADYTVGSIRKWTGTPDGGFAVCLEGTFKSKPTDSDSMLEKAKLEASFLKYNYLFNKEGEKSAFLEKFRVAEDILDKQKGWYTIGDMSSRVLSNLDVKTLKERRQANYDFVYQGVSSNKAIRLILPNIDNKFVPLYLPLYVENRKSLQSLFIQNSIYAPIVWPKPECLVNVCKNAEDLYNHILCIPIDQRYGLDDMERLLKILSSYVR